MPIIDLYLNGDNAWPDLADKEILNLDEHWKLAALEGGTASGNISLALRLDVPPEAGVDEVDVVITQTSLAAWIAATCSLRGRFPEAFDGTPLALSPIVDGQRRT